MWNGVPTPTSNSSTPARHPTNQLHAASPWTQHQVPWVKGSVLQDCLCPQHPQLWTPVTTHSPGGSEGKESACNSGDQGLIPGLGRSPGGGNGNPLQYSCLENPHGQRSLAGL